jgi:hypothetical protein
MSGRSVVNPIQIQLFAAVIEVPREYRVYCFTTDPMIPLHYPVSGFEAAKRKILELARRGKGRYGVDIGRIGLEVKDCGVWNEWRDVDGKTICDAVGVRP